MMTTSNSYNVRARTPDGVMYFTIVEDAAGNIAQILSSAGKTGSTLSLYVDAMCNLINFLLANKRMTINEILGVLSHYNTSAIVYNDGGVPVRSGIGGLVYAIQRYRNVRANYAAGLDLDI
jgi:glutaminase